MSNRTPLQHYLDDLDREYFVEDVAQKMAVEHFQRLYQELAKPKKQDSIWARFFGANTSAVPVRGLYLWGGVGRGKTYLMDIFFDSLPFKEKQRLHFHRFMRLVHTELKSLQGEKDPLQKVADRFASKYRVLCFDEFFVSDIGDAMILATLLEAFFARGVTLVATSNVVPNNLYKDGLQRSRFLPAIDLLNKHTKVLKVDGGNDYRLRTLEQLELYHFPADVAAENIINTNFHRLVADEEELKVDSNIEIENRPIAFRKKAEDVIWFDFEQVCGGPRSPADYIEISREFQSVLIHGVPCFDSFEKDDLARRFISLVDEFYDRSVKLILSAEVALDQLYSGGRLSFEFERTKSRLLEMQSADYLARAHKC
jgi:cell division protein ZapE